MNNCVETDIAIIGGGVAGLWTLNQLRKLGLSVILLESSTLGGGQTHKAQGIIHGGIKYALQGALTAASAAIADMPALWKACLAGQGEIDLSQVPILAHKQYIWSTGSLTSKFASFIASLSLKSNTVALPRSDFPSIFQNPEFHGQVYALDEIVIDTHALVRELMRPHQDCIYKIDPMQPEQIILNDQDELTALNITAGPMALTVQAKKYIFTAGAGNELILKKLQQHQIAMQRRPLHMVMVKHRFMEPLYAHCLGLNSVPRLTITSYPTPDNQMIWYLGGQIAEDGVQRSSAEQIAFAKQELTELFPWLDFNDAQFSTFMIDRAENLLPNKARPDSCYLEEVQNMLIAWPTKLALAPKLAREIVNRLSTPLLTPGRSNMRELRAWPMPTVALPVWEELL